LIIGAIARRDIERIAMRHLGSFQFRTHSKGSTMGDDDFIYALRVGLPLSLSLWLLIFLLLRSVV